MQCKFKAVLKTAVFANSLHQQRRSSCWCFPSHATICKDGTFVWGWGGCIFPPASSKLQISLLLGYNISSQMSLGKGFFSLLPFRPSPGNLHVMLWNSSHFHSSACMVIYFCPYNSLILVSTESALYLPKNIDFFFFQPCYYFSNCKSVLLWESVWNTSSYSHFSCVSLQLNFYVWIPWHCLQPWYVISDLSSTWAFLWHFESTRHGPNVPDKPRDPWVQRSLPGDHSSCFSAKSWNFGGRTELNFKISVFFTGSQFLCHFNFYNL